MKLGIISGAYFGKQGDVEGLKHMKDHGYECMDYNFLANTDTCVFYKLEGEEFEKALMDLREKVNSAGIEICQTHGPWRWPPRDLEEADRAERYEKMCKAIVATRILGSKYFVIHPMMPFGWDKDPYPEEFWRINKEFLTKLAKVGEKNGVIVCLENMPMNKLSISTPEATLKMVKEIDSPYLRVCLDTGHAVVLGVQPGDAVRQIGKEYLACLHVHDNNGERDLHWIPYTGVIDWNDFALALQEIGYEGVLSLETDIGHSMHLPKELKEYFEIGLVKVARQLTQKQE